tara:strand:- start:424 stop:1047 length:624 start_codon:yes stop_codon:yes gene_type:complete
MTEWHGVKYWRNRHIDERERLAGIPPSLIHARLSNYDGDHEAVAKWLREFDEHREAGVGLLFAGKHGSGKSHLAAAALRGAIRSYRQIGRYITANDYVRALDDERNNDGVLPDSYDEGNLIPYLRSMYDVVVLDDVDSIRQTAFAKREISDLLSSRCAKKLVTLITCHDGIDQLKFTVTAQFHGLVRASCVPVVLTSGDHRRSIRGA